MPYLMPQMCYCPLSLGTEGAWRWLRTIQTFENRLEDAVVQKEILE